MDVAAELGMSGRDAVLIVVSATGIYATVVILSRVFGQRAFAQASSFDLALVVGLGTRSVILEPNGRMSVIGIDAPIQEAVFGNVRGADRLASFGEGRARG